MKTTDSVYPVLSLLALTFMASAPRLSRAAPLCLALLCLPR